MAEGEHTMSATITLPDNLARDAAKVGLTPAAIELLVQVEVTRRLKAESEADEEDYEIRLSNEELRAQLEAAYSDAPDEDEKLWLAHSKRQLRRLTESDEW